MAELTDVRLLGAAEAVDIEVADGCIRSVSPAAGSREPRVLLPGLVDVHVHFRDPSPADDEPPPETLASGARAAAAGGYTEVFAMANTDPVTDTPERWAAMASRAAALPVGVHPVSALTVGLGGAQLVDIEAMRAAGAKLFSDDGRCLQDEGLTREAMARLAALDGVYAEHAQDSEIVGAGVVDASIAESLHVPGWPGAGEASIVGRDICLAAETGCAVHFCHVSTAEAVALVRDAKAEGLPVTAEVTPHHLMLSADDACATGPALKVNPPLRATADQRALREALLDGTLDIVATDHAPHPAARKKGQWADAAFGLTGLETALAVVAEVYLQETGAVDWSALAAVMSSNPRRLVGLPEVRLEPGGEASFCVVEERRDVVDPGTHRSLSRNSPFAGRSLGHAVVSTWRRGREVGLA